MRAECLIVVVILLAGVAGCGQKGPLVLPDAQRPHKKIGVPKPPAAPAPAEPTATGEAPSVPASPQ